MTTKDNRKDDDQYRSKAPLTPLEAGSNIRQQTVDRRQNFPYKFLEDSTVYERYVRQTVTLERIADLLESGRTKGYIVAPTGYGKSYLTRDIAMSAKPRNMLIVAPTNQIVEQIYDILMRARLDVGIIDKDKKEYDRHITVTTYHSLLMQNRKFEAKRGNYNEPMASFCAAPKQDRSSKGLDLSRYDLVVFDEVHKAIGDHTFDLIDKKLPESAIKIGMTATPMYSLERQVSHLLANQIDKIEYAEAVHSGYISSFKVIYAMMKISLDDVKLERGGQEYSLSSLKKKMNTAAANDSLVDIYDRLGFMFDRCMIFCLDIEHAETVAKRFNEAGILAEAVHGGLTSEVRKDRISRFKDRRLAVVTTVDVLREGYDDDGLTIVINARPMKSPVAVTQRSGRAFRIDPKNPNKIAIDVEMVFESELPSKVQTTFDDVVRAQQMAKNKEIEALMGHIAFRIKEREGKSTGDRKARIMPEVSLLKKIVAEPREMLTIQRERLGKKLGAPIMPEDFLPFSLVLNGRNINRQYAWSVFWNYRNDKDKVGNYITDTDARIEEPCVHRTLVDMIARVPHVQQNHYPVVLLNKQTGWDEKEIIEWAKETDGEAGIVEHRLEMYEPKVPYLYKDTADKLLQEANMGEARELDAVIGWIKEFKENNDRTPTRREFIDNVEDGPTILAALKHGMHQNIGTSYGGLLRHAGVLEDRNIQLKREEGQEDALP
ncbi:MAG: DEAD/DEAH box helicase family protein [Candidatus Micrarchaeota archaeon]|nr:DEAD/DEAH box helicase family protein [Candidatus Micrarchaeota archaeon]